MTLTSWGLLLGLVGAAMLAWAAVRMRLNEQGNLDLDGLGRSRGWSVLGWLFIVAAFVLQFIDSLHVS